MRKAVSVTLKADNLLWLKGQAATTARGSVSEVLDQIVTEARLSGRSEPGALRSVKGTIDLPDDDPDLEQADAFIRATFAESVSRPMLLRERAAVPARPTKRKRRG